MQKFRVIELKSTTAEKKKKIMIWTVRGLTIDFGSAQPSLFLAVSVLVGRYRRRLTGDTDTFEILLLSHYQFKQLWYHQLRTAWFSN